MTNPKQLREEVTWNCRFHPTDWWHEVGCPHKCWSNEELQSALVTAKQSHAIALNALHTHEQEVRREERETVLEEVTSSIRDYLQESENDRDGQWCNGMLCALDIIFQLPSIKNNSDYKNQVNEAEKEWLKEKNNSINPLNIQRYIKAAQKYNQKMSEITFKALSEGNDKEEV